MWTSLAALWVVVDQMDAGVVAIELPDRQIVYLPAPLLPQGIEEGDRLRLELHAIEDSQPGRKPHSKKRNVHEHAQ